MLTENLVDFVGENVEITINRKNNVRIYQGKLVTISKSFVCLFVNGREKWIKKPNKFGDSVKKLS